MTNRLLAFRHGFCFDPAVLGVYNKDPASFSARSALSVKDSLQILDAARSWILEKLPEDVRDEQQALFDRRMRFGFARLWVIWRDGTASTQPISDILGFQSFDRKVLSGLARMPLLSGRLMLAWMTIRMRPFGVVAMLEAWWRTFRFNRSGRAAIQRQADTLREVTR